MAGTLDTLQALADLAELPQLPPAGIGWTASRRLLIAQDAAAAEVVTRILDVFPEAATRPAEGILSLRDELAVISGDALTQAISGVTELSGAAVLHTVRLAVAKSIVAAWREADTGRALYDVADEAEAARTFAALGFDEADRIEDYSARLGLFQAVTKLDELGIVEFLTPSPQEIQQNPAIIIAAIVIALAAFVTALAYIAVVWSKTSQMNDRWTAACLDANGKIRPGLEKVCAGQIDANDGGIGWQEIAIVAAVGTGLFFLLR